MKYLEAERELERVYGIRGAADALAAIQRMQARIRQAELERVVMAPPPPWAAMSTCPHCNPSTSPASRDDRLRILSPNH